MSGYISNGVKVFSVLLDSRPLDFKMYVIVKHRLLP